MKRLPSLQTIRAFEASIRHGSFTRAGEELHLTHGAISRHVQKLEAWYGKPLFERQGPRVQPTVAGEGLRQRLMDPLQGLYQALEAPTRLQRDALYVSTLVSIAETWILPNLDDFKQQCPNIDLTVATDYQVLSIPPASKVVALRYGQFDHRGLFAEELLDESMVAVASPAWLACNGEEPADWPTDEMMVHTATPWPAALKTETGMIRLPVAQGPRFNDAFMCLQAAKHGMGVAWTRCQMARAALGRGDLVAIEPLRQKSDRSYWFVCREELIHDPTLALFRQWIHDVIKGDRRPA